MKAKIFFIGEKTKKNRNGQLKKASFSSSANSQYFFMKILWIGPWLVELNDAKGIVWLNLYGCEAV